MTVTAIATRLALFSFDERIALARSVLSDISNVSVDGYNGLTVSYATDNGLGVIVRGLRAVTDFEYEFQLASMNRNLDARVETIFMTPTEEYTFISSSLVREVAALGGDVKKFVHADVAAALQARNNSA